MIPTPTYRSDSGTNSSVSGEQVVPSNPEVPLIQRGIASGWSYHTHIWELWVFDPTVNTATAAPTAESHNPNPIFTPMHQNIVSNDELNPLLGSITSETFPRGGEYVFIRKGMGLAYAYPGIGVGIWTDSNLNVMDISNVLFVARWKLQCQMLLQDFSFWTNRYGTRILRLPDGHYLALDWSKQCQTEAI